MSIRIYNVLNGKKDLFKPQKDNEVSMYACGITVSDNAHIGHAYQAIVFDMIKKYFEYKGYNVKYVRNYTDVDDKIINKANELQVDPLDYAKKLMIKTDAELINLGVDLPIQCKATEHIEDMIEFIQKLIDKGFAYSTEYGDVYFAIEKFPRYGQFSKNEIDETIGGTRKEIEPGKKDERDFALWKSSKPGEPFWQSPWGEGRPGWHIECSTMSMKYLGETLDIHGGGQDLKFPHHENEIAQSEALTGKRFANYWIHNGLIKINGQKMSKSLGNSILIEDLLKKYSLDAIRLTLLQNNYRSEMNIVDGIFEQSEEKVYKIYRLFDKIDELASEGQITAKDSMGFSEQIKKDFSGAMDIDFNSALAISKLLKYISTMNSLIEKKENISLLKYMKSEIIAKYKVLGLFQSNPVDIVKSIVDKKLNEIGITKQEIERLVAQINSYKAEKNYMESDKIRKMLLAKNLLIKDTKEGTIWDIKII